MPLQRCQTEGSPGWKWGGKGKCFTGGKAKERAVKQGRSIRASGFAGNAHRRIRTRVVPSNPLKADPTRSATLRRIFTTDLTRRFFALKSKILRLIVDEDAFGLRRSAVSSFRQLTVGNDGASLATNQRWVFQTDPQKVASFQQWLATQIQTDILTTTAENLENVYWQRYVEEGYRKGAGRAFDDTRKAALNSGADVSDFYEGTREEFLRSAFAQPVAIEKVKLLTGRVFTDLKGVTEAMSAQITRALADGLVQGQNPRQIARELNKVVDGIGKYRAMLIARTEIIRAHAEGQLDAFDNLGVEKVGVAAEWSTAGDDRVCPLCQPLEGTIMTVKEARGILPRHPQCRCAWIPANVGESKTDKTRVNFTNPDTGEVETKFIGTKRSKTGVRKAINDSIRAEIPKRQVGKRTLAQQKKRTSWAGADKRIAKKRPRGILEPAKVAPKVKKPRAVFKEGVATQQQVEIELLKRTRKSGFEHGAIFDSRRRLIGSIEKGRKKGNLGGQGIQLVTRPSMPDNLIKVHTHPPGPRRAFTRPSDTDISNFYFDAKVGESNVLTADGGRWVIKEKKGFTGRLSGHDIKELRKRIEEDLIIDIGLDPATVQFDVRVLKELGDQIGLDIKFAKTVAKKRPRSILDLPPSKALPKAKITPKFQGKPANPKGLDTLEQYRRADGSWTGERQVLHDKIIASNVGTARAIKKPVSYMMGGGPASGKSAAIKAGRVKIPKNHVLVDSDELKKALPEFEVMTAKGDSAAAAFAHEESSYLSKRLLDEAVDQNKHVLLDGTGDSSLEKLRAKILNLRKKGRKIVANYVTVDTEVAVARNLARAKRTGRLVPEEYVKQVHASISDVVPKAVKEGLFDEFALYDTNLAGQVRLVASAKGKKLVIHDNGLWERFLAKGRG